MNDGDWRQKTLLKAYRVLLANFAALEKKGFVWKRTRHAQRGRQNLETKAIKQADLALLQQACVDGHLELKYLDESGCCLESPVSYSYSRINQQKCLDQVKFYGDRISILGVWQPDKSFEYALVQGSFNKERYVRVMNTIADKSEQTLKQTGRITVIVQDNGPAHTSHFARGHWQQWQSQGLYLFFLPQYSSEINLIEAQWHLGICPRC
ncbi:transposase [Leptolyngbya sp. ST-U4]|uniref:transposase n=1 Tax=Leptolyngbya sp. ST-U4 TaxID=2933912 RepID=UPI0032981C5F